MDDRRDSSWKWNGFRTLAWAAITLLVACGAPAAPPARSGTDRETGTTTPPASPAVQPAALPTPAAQPAQPGRSADVKAPSASLAELSEHALAVQTYGSEDPSRCGLKTPGGGSPPSSVRVFFGCTPQSGPVVAAVPARVVPVPTGDRPERVAVEALLTGPTSQESEAGYVSNFGDASRGIGFTAEIRNDGTAVVNFDEAIRQRARAFVSNLDARQVVATLGQFPGVKRVLILVEGEPLCKALGEC